MDLVVSTRRVTRVLASVAVVLCSISLVGQILGQHIHRSAYGHISRLFDVTKEQNFPTWYSSMLLATAAVTLGIIAARARKTNILHWKFLSLAFAYLSLDEASSIHELGNLGFKKLTMGLPFFRYPWVIGGIASVVVLGLVFIPFLQRLHKPLRRGLLTAGAIYIFGALVMEMVGASYAQAFGNKDIPYAALCTIEELLEMSGAIYLIRTLLLHLQEQSKSTLSLRVVDR